MNRAAQYIEFSPRAAEAIGMLNKGLGAIDRPLTAAEIASLGWNVLHEDISLPAAVLYEEKLKHNLKWMQMFANTYGAKLAPHGKTTMAPRLFQRQLQAGAWGITLATAHQTMVAFEHGVRRVLMANQLVGRRNMEIISRLLKEPEFEFFCLVDSADLAAGLSEFFVERQQRLNVLLELGAPDGRTGVRNREQFSRLKAALDDHRERLRLCGVEIYEGVLSDEAPIRELLKQAVEAARELVKEKRFDRSPVILSGAGSSWYDVVADEFSKADIGEAVEVVLRPGCYLTHDVGAYETAQKQIQRRNPIAQKMSPGLQPVLQVWAYVQSVPEWDKAIVAMGKRDAAFDAGFPTPVLHYRPGTSCPQSPPANWTVTRMMDQHSYMRVGEHDDIRVGDMIAFDISHPCLTFDKWRCLPIVDSEYRVIDVVQTYF